jgi:HK97 gp10 family phage protein
MMSGGIRMTWNSDVITKKLEGKVRGRLRRIGAMLRKYIIMKITKGKTRRDGPSKPGQPPHVDTGRLRQSIAWELHSDGRGVRIGTNVNYGKYLEEGTRHMAPRPYLRPSLKESRAMIKMILSGSLDRKK